MLALVLAGGCGESRVQLPAGGEQTADATAGGGPTLSPSPSVAIDLDGAAGGAPATGPTADSAGTGASAGSGESTPVAGTSGEIAGAATEVAAGTSGEIAGAASVAAGTSGEIAGAASEVGSGNVVADDHGSSEAPALADAGSGPEAERPPEVVLPAGVADLLPRPGSTQVCPDAALRIRFDGPPTLGRAGRVLLYDARESSAPLVTIDLSTPTPKVAVGGVELNVPSEVYTAGNEVIVPLTAEQLGYGRSVYVLLEGEGIGGPAGTLRIGDPEVWSFRTADAPPASVASLRVGVDSNADFCSVQGALDAALEGSTLEIAAASYPGPIRLENKDNITLRGAGRDSTVLFGENNEALNGGTRARPLFFAENVRGLHIEDLTLRNTTPQGGTQAEALALLSCDECVVRDATIESLQDTLLWSGKIYADNCLIVGNVDYIWGTGTAYFNACEIRTVGRKGYNLQARNGSTTYGYVFVDSRLTAEAGISGDMLARIDVGAYPSSHVAYIDCEMGPHISGEGWVVTGTGPTTGLRFWEYGSHSAEGTPTNVASRHPASRQLSAAEADAMRDPSVVFGGWVPPGR